MQRSSQTCISTCAFVNSTVFQTVPLLMCELMTDSVNCPFVSYLSPTAQSCVSSCPSPIYFMNGTLMQCNATCALPFGLLSTVVAGSQMCSACPNFVDRTSSNCVSSCTYVNATTVNSTSVTVCETLGANCPFYSYLNATAFTCQATCLP